MQTTLATPDFRKHVLKALTTGPKKGGGGRSWEEYWMPPNVFRVIGQLFHIKISMRVHVYKQNGDETVCRKNIK